MYVIKMLMPVVFTVFCWISNVLKQKRKVLVFQTLRFEQTLRSKTRYSFESYNKHCVQNNNATLIWPGQKTLRCYLER